MDVSQIKLCSPILGIDPDSNSGGEVFDRELLLALANLGVSQTLLLPRARPYPSHSNFQVAHTLVQTMFPPYIFNFFAYWHLFSMYQKFNFNTLRVHSPHYVGPAAYYFRTRFPHVKLIANYHHLEDSQIKDFLDRRYIHHWDAITVDSQFTRTQLLDRFPLNPHKVNVIYPGSSEHYQPTSISLSRIPTHWKSCHKLLFLGGLKPRKNVSFLLDVLATLPPNYVLIIAGSGSLLSQLQSQTLTLGIFDRVLFWGYVQESEKSALYSWADLLLSPSLLEGFGMVPIQAQSCGTPVIVSNRGSLPEVVIPQKTGWILPLQVSAWSTQIKNYLTPKIHPKTSSECIKFASQFSWEKSAIQFIKVCKKLLSS